MLGERCSFCAGSVSDDAFGVGLVFFPQGEVGPCVCAECPCLPLSWEVSQPLGSRDHLPFSSASGKEKDTDSSTGAGRKGPDGSLQGDVYKKSHACCPSRTQRKKKKKNSGGRKKKAEKPLQTNIGIARLLPEVPRSQEVPGAAQRTGARPLRVPSHPGLSAAPSAAAGLPAFPPTPQAVAPGPPGPPGPLGPPGPGAGRCRCGCSAPPAR